jgi:transposase
VLPKTRRDPLVPWNRKGWENARHCDLRILMARTAPRPTPTSEQHDALLRLAARKRSARNQAFRAQIVLRSAEGLPDVAVARELRCNKDTVRKWRQRFLLEGIDGLHDEPRPGAERKIGDDEIERIVVKTLETTPKGATHWSTRQMAKQSGISHSSIGRIWRAFGLKPHRADSFQLSKDPLLVEKVRDIVGLYMNPPNNAVVLCIDEKTQIQALNRTQPVLPMRVGETERRTTDYERHGTTTLFAALDVATGNVIGRCFQRHRASEFLKFLKDVDGAVPAECEAHVVIDNYATHKTPAVKRWLLKRPRFHLHFTPTHASWLNQVERWFGLLTERQLKRGSHRSVVELRTAIEQFIEVTNETPKPFVWTKTADDILGSIARFASRTLKAHAPQSSILREIKDPGD